jgi:hypothetical protein
LHPLGVGIASVLLFLTLFFFWRSERIYDFHEVLGLMFDIPIIACWVNCIVACLCFI